MSNYAGRMKAILGLDKRGFDKGMKEAQSGVARFAQRMHQIGKNVARAGAGISVASTGVVLAIRQQMDAAGDVGRLAQLSNTGVRDFQRFAIAAKEFGVEQDKLSDILKDVSDRVGDFLQTGGGPMKDFFENIAPQVGVTAENFKDLSGADALQLYVSSLEKANLNQSEMTFYLEAMASDTTALIPLLRDGGSEMNRLADAAESAGAIMSEDTVKSSRQFSESLGRIGLSMRAVVIQITASLAPSLARLAEIAASAVAGFTKMSPVMQQVAAGAAAAVAVAGPLALGLGAVLMAVKPLLAGLALLASPIGLVVGGFAALVAGSVWVVRNWDAVVEKFPALGRAVEAVSNTAGPFVAFMRDQFMGVLRATGQLVEGDFSGAFRSARTVAGNLIDAVLRLSLEITQGLGGAVAAVVEGFPQMFRSAMDGARQALEAGWVLVKTTVGGWVSDFVQMGRDIVEGLRVGIQEQWASLREYITSLGSELPDWIKKPLGIQSPSRVFAQIGNDIMSGLSMGIGQGSDGAVAGLMQVADRLTGAGGGMVDGLKRVGQTAGNVFSTIGQNIGGLIRGTMKWREALKGVLSSMAQVFAQRAQASAVKAFGGQGSLGGSLIGGLISGLTGFEGGGWTGNGARVGGLDGKGGFLAMMHPREHVSDSVKGQGGGGAVRVIGGDLTLTDNGQIATRIRVEAVGAVKASLPSWQNEYQQRGTIS